MEKLQRIINQFGFKIVDGEIDLRNRDNKDVLKFFYTLAETGTFLFHGSNSQNRFDILEARQANDSAKASGNKMAVYADEGIGAPLIAALLNKGYIRTKFENFITGWSSDSKGRMISKVTPNVYSLFKSGDQNLFSDGYIYVLDKTDFVNAEDAGAEWHSENSQKPLLSCRIARKLAEDVFIVGKGEADTVIEYMREEIDKMNEKVFKLK